MRRASGAIAVLLAGLALGQETRGDTFFLVGGDEVDGRLVREGAAEIAVEVAGGGQVVFKRADVVRREKNAKGAPPAQKPKEAAPPPARDVPAAPTATAAAPAPADLSALARALGEPDPAAREAAATAAEALARRSPATKLDDLLPLLVASMRDPARGPRAAANRALEAITGKRFGYAEGARDELSDAQIEAIEKWERWLKSVRGPSGED